MRTVTKETVVAGMFTALLIAAQLALSAISGVEVVTVLLLSFCMYFGKWRGMVVATAFSTLRCLIFGFFPTVIILYLIYYNAFALLFGFIGERWKAELNVKRLALTVALAVIMTALFSMLDNVITPLFYGFGAEETKAYFLASFTAMVPQCICAFVTVSFLLMPLLKVYKSVIKINA